MSHSSHRTFVVRSLFSVWFCFFVLFICSLAAQAAEPIAFVQTALGQVNVRRTNIATLAALRARSELNAGDRVSTGPNGKASLLFFNGAQLRLNANTSIEITSPTSVGQGRSSFFRAISGEVWARLRPGQAAQTRSAIAGVRGTEFVLQVADDDTTTLTVIEGSVNFFNPFGSVIVEQNQQSVARPGSAPTIPVTIQNAGLIVEWTLDLNRALIPRETVFVSFNRNQLQGQIAQRRQAALAAPQNAGAQAALGDALFDAGQFDVAFQAFTQAQALAPQDQTVSLRLARTLLELNRMDEAEAVLQPLVPGLPAILPVALEEEGEQPSIAAQAATIFSQIELAREHPKTAQAVAQRALELAPNSSEAQIALGLALTRQNGKLEEAATAFRAALTATPSRLRYQARSWLALVYLAQQDSVAATREARQAVQLAPESGLAHGNLALVYFFSGATRQAENEARLAAKLNPNSVAARVVLGQVLLAQGDVDAGVATAAQAVALDPDLPQAHYLLGLADAGRRDWSHAARSLRESLRLEPDFLPAASALARVYNFMGRQSEAVALLTDLLPRYRQADEVRAALGQVYYQQGNYSEALAQYDIALKAKPESALYWAESARVLLDANRLNEAINAGQKAVALAPQVAQYHALLGLTYDFSGRNGRFTLDSSGLQSQAEREFRTALTLDPQNALAHARLGTLQALADPESGFASYNQAFLYDPAVADEFQLRGINTTLSPSTGSQSQLNGFAIHNQRALDGDFHSFNVVNSQGSDDDGKNNRTRTTTFNSYTTQVIDQRTTLFAGITDDRTRQGLPGPAVLGEDPDDKRTGHTNNNILAMRHRLSAGTHLWVGMGYDRLHTTSEIPSLPTTALPLSDFNTIFNDLLPEGFNIANQKVDTKFNKPQPEIRADVTLNRTSERPTLLSFGFGQSRTHIKSNEGILLTVGGDPVAAGTGLLDVKTTSNVFYAQASRQMNSRLSLIGQLRLQKSSEDDAATLRLLNVDETRRFDTKHESKFSPSFVGSYLLDKRTTARLFANRRTLDFTTLSFAPTEPLIATESDILPRSDFFSQSDILELDVERYLKRGFIKVFAFHSKTDGVRIGSGVPSILYEVQPALFAVNLDSVKRMGAGVRLEQRLSPTLFANAALVFNRSIADAPGQVYDDKTAPYQPRYRAAISLDYIDRHGNKLGLVMRREGGYYQDSLLGSVLNPGGPRPTFPAHTYFDLRLAKEPSKHHEAFLLVHNLFDRPTLNFNQFPGVGRQVELGYSLRF